MRVCHPPRQLAARISCWLEGLIHNSPFPLQRTQTRGKARRVMSALVDMAVCQGFFRCQEKQERSSPGLFGTSFPTPKPITAPNQSQRAQAFGG